MAYILTRELDDDFVFAPSGRKWIDVMQRGVSKATGVSQVLDAHGIRAHEMMAFGGLHERLRDPAHGRHERGHGQRALRHQAR